MANAALVPICANSCRGDARHRPPGLRMAAHGRSLRIVEPKDGHHRSQTGNILAIIVALVVLVIVPLIVVLYQFGMYLVHRERVRDLVDAAGLLAANDMSRIIVDDPNFGYVSLSNYPPIGRATRAPDGEPLPVIGINTLVGTIRQNAIVARELANQTMLMLVAADRASLDETINELNLALSDALSGNNELRDIHGEAVDPVKDVTAFLIAHLPDNMQLESLRLSNGWLRSGGTTTIAVPQPPGLALVQDGECRGTDYNAFVDIPVDGHSFSFAGLGWSSSIVDPLEFQAADRDHICSIVKIECTVTLKDRPWMPFGILPNCSVECVACCQPYTQQDAAPRGAMTVRFPGGPVPGLQSWRDFLRHANFHDHQVRTYDVVGGDYPVDRDARMSALPPDTRHSSAQQFAEHLYYWLRNGHVRPRIDAILAMVDESFRSCPNEVYAYEFSETGDISREIIACGPFPVAVTADAQFHAVVDTSIANGMTPIIVFRNNVRYLGTKNGGKHAGQPLAGYPLTACEVRACASNELMALRFGQRQIYHRGLALDIEIGGTRGSDASRDVASMRQLQSTRRI